MFFTKLRNLKRLVLDAHTEPQPIAGVLNEAELFLSPTDVRGSVIK